MITIRKLTVGKWKVNCYFIFCEDEAWIVDPGDEIESIINFFDLDNYKLNGIISTHGHFDHIGAVAEIKERYNIPFFLHSKDKRLATQGNLYRRMVGDIKLCKTPIIDQYLDDLQFLELKKFKIVIHHTPGHTNGGVCLEIKNNIFAGDMLLNGSSSISNLPGFNKKLMFSSLNYLIDNFKGFIVNPGHGESFILDTDSINKFKIMP